MLNRQRQIQRLSQRLNRQSEREARAAVHLNQNDMRRVRRKLIIFYAIFLTVDTIFVILTLLFWNRPSSDDETPWQVTFCKACPLGILTLFGLFNIWIQCFNKQISRQIIHPWVTCRCHLYMFLIVFPLTMASAEISGIYLYIKYWTQGISILFKVLACISLLPANWFLFTLAKWCIFVRKYVRLRERRVNQLLFLLEQEE